MADPLSIASSIAGLIVLTEELFHLICKFRDAKEDIQSLTKEIRSLSVLLYDLSLLAKSFEDNQKFDTYFRLHYVNDCRETVQNAKSRLEKAAGRLKGGRVRAIGTKLIWPYSENEVEKLLEDISRHKETMTLALSADSMKNILQTLSKQDELSNDIEHLQTTINEIQTRIALDKQQSDVLNFFLHHNPQPNLEMSLSLRHPLTGLWFTEGSDFKNWLNSSQNGRLWLSGIPGAGKTVLSGLIIEECLKKSWIGSGTVATCFFFCDYKDSKSQDVTSILSCLASQLARQSTDAFEILAAYHADLHPEKSLPKSPSISALLEILVQMSECFDKVFMVVDGLDECGLGSSLTKDLCWLVENAPTISMAVLSRAEQHILEELDGGFTHVEIAAQSGDVQLYVRAELRERIQKRKLRIRRAALEGEIIQALIDGAQGMFRWVSCQLDYLCELPTDTDRKGALGKLPPTLNATYQRILDDTQPELIHIMQITLRLIAAAGPDITIPQLCDALSLRDGKLSVDEDDRLDEEEISRICRSLIRKSNDKNHFEFAHFTVREFLESPSLLNTPLEQYHIESDETWFLIDFCLRFIHLENFSKPLYAPIDIIQSLEDIDDSHPFYHFATWKWPFIFRSSFARLEETHKQNISYISAKHTHLASVLLHIDKLFHPDKSPHFLLWSVNLALIYRRSYKVCDNTSYILPELIHADFTPLHMGCILSLEYPTLRLIGQQTDTSVTSSTCPSPIKCVLLGMPALLHDVLEDLETDILGESEIDILIIEWMGPNTSRDIWGDFLKHLPAALALESQKVKFGGLRYSVLDLFCERGLDFLRWAKDFLHFMLPGATLNQESISKMQDMITDYEWPSDDAKQEKELYSVLRSIYERAPDVFTEESLLFSLQRLLAEIEIIGNSSLEKIYGLEIGGLQDREYDSSVELAVEYDNVARLRQLSCDRRFQTYHNREPTGKSLLHIAVTKGATRALELLLTLGLEVSWQDHDGNTPLHLAVPGCIKSLMEHGASDAVRNNNGSTVWHQETQYRKSSINILLKISSEIASRLVDVNDEGYTPMTMALLRDKNEDAALLLPHCHDVAAFVGPEPVYEEALYAGMDHIIEGLIAAGIPVDPGTSPIHRVASGSSIRCLRLLKSLCPGACSQRQDGRLPIENILDDLYLSKGGLEKELVLELIPEEELAKVDCLEYLCTVVIPSLEPSADMEEDEVPLALKLVLEAFLEHGVCEAYEKAHGQSVTNLFANALLCHVGDSTTGWDRISSLDSTMVRVLKASQFKVKADMSPLMHLSVYAGWVNVLGELLGAEDNVLENINHSCLEFACQPFDRCSLATFDLLLMKSHVNDLNQLNANSGLALIHLLANKDVSERVEKLTKLLEMGVDPNARCRRNAEPALVYHVWEFSFDTVKLLLQNKANPELVDDDGFIAMFAMVWIDDLDSLQILRECHPNTDWKHTMIMRPGFFDTNEDCKVVTDTEVQHCNVLHVAAAVRSLKCLKYLAEEDLVSDINAKAGLGYTCAHFAATLGLPVGREMLLYLKSKYCDLNALNDLNETPLDTAIQCNMPEGNIDILLALGAQPAGTTTMELLQDNATNKSGRLWLIEHDVLPRVYDSNAVTKRRLQLLSKAIENGDLTACKRLYAQGCPLTAALPVERGIPIIWAIIQKQTAIVEWLLESGGGKWANSPDLAHMGPIQLALTLPDCNNVLKALLIHFESVWPELLTGNRPALMVAISSSNMDGLRIVLEFLADEHREHRKPRLFDILHARQELPPFHAAVAHDNVDAVKILLEYGASLDTVEKFGHGPLHRAISTSSYDTLHYLLEAGSSCSISACPNKNIPGGTPLDYALRYNNLKALHILKPYLKASDRVTVGKSPFALCKDLATFAWLVNHGFELPTNIEELQESIFKALPLPNCGCYILQNQFITKLGLDQHAIPVTYRSDLVFIIPQMLRVLGCSTMKTMLPTEPLDCESPLSIAAGQGLVSSCQALISMGAELDFEGHSLGTPLMVACALRRNHVVSFLVRAGAKIRYWSAQSGSWKSAFSIAEGCPEICRWLLVERYTKQIKISLQPHSAAAQTISSWSGGGKVGLSLIGVRERQAHESLLDYAWRLAMIRVGLRGEEVLCPVAVDVPYS